MPLIKSSEVFSFSPEPEPELGYACRVVDELTFGWSGSRLRVVMQRIPIVKETPRGFQVGWPYSRPRQVLDDACKQYACRTVEEAKASFIARKKKQLKILRAQLKQCEEAIELFKKGEIEED